MDNIKTGNASQDTKDTRGWLVGHFIQDKLSLKHSDEVEIKWGFHLAGELRKEWVTSETRTSIGILVSGKFIVEFRDQEIVSDTPGDYVMWGEGTDHKWRAVEDSVWLTVRWPSIES